MVGFHSGLCGGLPSHRCRLLERSLVRCVSRDRLTVCLILRVFCLLLFPCGIDTPRAIPTAECSVPFVPFGSWEVSWLVSARVCVAACLPIAADSWSGLWLVAFHATV